MKKSYLIIFLVLCLSSLYVHAQENNSRQIYNQAESEYKIGHIEQAIQLLQDNIGSFDGILKQNVYRLLALCHLSEDHDEEALYYAGQLIKLNNYYNSTDDPARFQDLVSQLKEGIATTITTASSQSETINEAPVPITIITSEMIEELGYNKNLGQILAAYVPGMAEMRSYDEGVNMSIHGAYANGQELILIMEDGHRLNTRFDNSGPTSYSVSTEKIDHIEVLRGPASSLYGNVALSAVVNIITKSGRTTDGVKAKYGHATYNTHRADLSMGTQFMDADIFAWASIYYSDGQIRSYDDGEGYLKNSFKPIEELDQTKTIYISPDKVYVDGYKETPTYDIGLTFRIKGFDLLFSKKNVKKVFKHTLSCGGYEYDKFQAINGNKPGFGAESTHAELGYSRQLKNIRLNASLYSDWYNISNYEVIYDSIISVHPTYDENSEHIIDKDGNIKMDTEYLTGRYSYTQYNEHTIGGNFRASTDYYFSTMKGSILAGGQYEYFSLKSAQLLNGSRFGDIESHFSYDEILKAGRERSLSFFIQDKHYFLPQLILNAGFRYDLKYRQEEDVVKTFSPRLALMYVPNERFSLKLSYSEAFADLSFFYRYITKTKFYSSTPQHLSAIQLTAIGTIPSLHLNYEVNLFHNKYTDLLCWMVRDIAFGKNTGRLTNIGIEGTANYAYKRFSTILTLYLCKDTHSEHYYYNQSKKMVCGVPHFTLNLHGAWKLLQKTNHEIKIYGHSAYTGRKLNYTMSEESDFFIKDKLLFDLGFKYRYKQRLQLSFDCENILDTDHYLSGPSFTYVPEFQRGRSLMASISYQF